MTIPPPEASAAREHQYHPFEIFVCDPAGRIADRLCAELVDSLSADLNVALVKDTSDRVRSPGDPMRLVRLDTQDVLSVTRGGLDVERALLPVDGVVIQTTARANGPTIYVVGDGNPGALPNAIAYVSDPAACPILPASAPYFTSEQLEALSSHILSFWAGAAATVPLIGLVLAGGGSTRMGRDKGSLENDGQSQAARRLALLRECCEEAFVSIRRPQRGQSPYRDMPCIADRFDGFGPIGGVLSAMTTRREAAWLVLACDMPNLNGETLDALLGGRNPFRAATCFRASDGAPEPLCSVYEPKSVHFLMERIAAGDSSLRRMLSTGPVALLDAPGADALLRVNTEAEWRAYLSKGSPA